MIHYHLALNRILSGLRGWLVTQGHRTSVLQVLWAYWKYYWSDRHVSTRLQEWPRSSSHVSETDPSGYSNRLFGWCLAVQYSEWSEYNSAGVWWWTNGMFRSDMILAAPSIFCDDICDWDFGEVLWSFFLQSGKLQEVLTDILGLARLAGFPSPDNGLNVLLLVECALHDSLTLIELCRFCATQRIETKTQAIGLCWRERHVRVEMQAQILFVLKGSSEGADRQAWSNDAWGWTAHG